MRIGYNPQKDKSVGHSDYFHQIIIPLYIPNQEGYFKDSFDIFKNTLISLWKTVHSNTYLTIVNNGSCTEVVNYLNKIYDEGKIHELISTTHIGKKNAIAKGLIGHKFTFVTVVDSDVLFMNDWQKATYDIFFNFPKVGVVSPAPNPLHIKYYTANILFDVFFNSQIKFRNNLATDEMRMFAKSINNEALFKDAHLKKCLSIRKNKVNALVGAGHFVVTYRSDALDSKVFEYSKFAMGGNSMRQIDEIAYNLGFWRVSTEMSYALHMGNVLEDWMEEKLNSLKSENTYVKYIELDPISKLNFVQRFLKLKLFRKIIFFRPFKIYYFGLKGLTSDEAKIY